MTTTLNSIKQHIHCILNSRNILIIACCLIVAGYLLMYGDGSSLFESVALQSDQAFNPDIFSTRRIVVAPILCLTGYLLIIVGILRKQ